MNNSRASDESLERLSANLLQIESVFPEFLEKKTIKKTDIKAYFRSSYWGYALFHSWQGALHMGLSHNGTFSKQDYSQQAAEIHNYLSSRIADTTSQQTLSVLEVGCGWGFNLRYLAERLPLFSFCGVDITEKHIQTARRMSGKFSNLIFLISDYHNLDEIQDSSVDFVIAIETLCYSTNLEKALESISRVLKPGGEFVIYDAFRENGSEENPLKAKLAHYVERAMSVPTFPLIETFIKTTQKVGLKYTDQNNLNQEVMPNLLRFAHLAHHFFKSRWRQKIILCLVPRNLTRNAVAGLLMHTTIEIKTHSYMKFKFIKA